MSLRPTLICGDRVAFAVVASRLSVLVIDRVQWDPAFVDSIYDDTARLHDRVPHSLVVLAGGVPDAAARARMGERQREIEDGPSFDEVQYTAVITGSAVARGVLTAFGWLTRRQKTSAFSPDDEAGAIAWLGQHAGTDPVAVREALDGCRARLPVPSRVG